MPATKGIPLSGDRSAWDTEDYATKHAADIADTGISPRYHWTETQLNVEYVRLDGGNQTSWIPNPGGDATQDITGNFNLSSASYSFQIGGVPVLQTWATDNVAIGHGWDAS